MKAADIRKAIAAFGTEKPKDTCPACGGSMTIDKEAEMDVAYVKGGFQMAGQPFPTKRVKIHAAFCNHCEHVTLLKQITQI
jgi:hypothetical protein